MKLYFATAKFNWSKVLSYPFEIMAFIIGRLFGLGFLVLFWYAAAKSFTTPVDFQSLIAYFLVANAVKDFTFGTDLRFGQTIQRQIKSGEINNYLVKPVKVIPFLFSTHLGTNGLNLIYAMASLLVGLILAPPLTWLNVVGFLIFLILALPISLSFNTLVGLISFHSSEGSGFRNASAHVVRVLSGAVVPLNLFPDFWRQILYWSPFPAVAFSPAYVLQNQMPIMTVATLFVSALGWSILLLGLTVLVWRYSLKKYEGIGI